MSKSEYKRLDIQWKARAKELEAKNAELVEEVEMLKAIIKPFAHPDLSKMLGGNAEGDKSPVFQRDKAMLTIGDFKKAKEAITSEVS